MVLYVRISNGNARMVLADAGCQVLKQVLRTQDGDAQRDGGRRRARRLSWGPLATWALAVIKDVRQRHRIADRCT